jgi:hypothetical protein
MIFMALGAVWVRQKSSVHNLQPAGLDRLISAGHRSSSIEKSTAMGFQRVQRITAPVGLFIFAALAIVAYRASSAAAVAPVTVIAVSVNHSSAKIFYNPVPGAKDYRIYDVANPNNVKYAGWTHISPDPECPGPQCFRHFVTQADGVTPVFPYQASAFSYPDGGSGGPQVLDVPATEIEWNNLGDNQPHTLIVEAVDQLGPSPLANLYTSSLSNNTPLAPGGMLGSNKGATPDGKTSTNGQGPYTNNPHVIAQSPQIVVKANNTLKAIPSLPSAGQTFYDTFDQSENSSIALVSRSDSTTDAFGNLGQMQYSMNAGTPIAWDIIYRQANNRDSMPFIASDHFMDMIFDGATPGVAAPTRTIYGSMSMTPTKTVDITAGKILHMTMEVDGHVTINRRWMDFNIAPASDPIQRWDYFGAAVNNSNQALFLEMKDGRCTLNIFNGPGGPAPGVPPTDGGGGAGFPCDWAQNYSPTDFTKDGLGLDDRSRYDLFLSQTHVALFINGRLIGQKDIPAGTFPWSSQPLKTYYSHYLYHSDIEWSAELVSFSEHGQNYCYPLNSIFINDPVNGFPASGSICNTAFPPGYGYRYSDERHWDNMGFEVLPASASPTNDFTGFTALVQPPAQQPPTLSGAPGSPTGLRIVGLLLDALFPSTQPKADAPR